ncbi:MAG TPA: phenylalanine--tRNA ligase subunit beta, partial [Candidatus Methylomirabilis sp.]|nr:phenylalanine--tRNA ligase subunit beta [Candidatus Methylomirabilis sp.]
VSLLSRFAAISVAKGVIDVGGQSVKRRQVAFRPARATRIMGREYTPDACREIFGRLGFPVGSGGPGSFDVTVPTHRFDIEREIDLVEEVARLSGYDTIPTTYPESNAPDFSEDDRFVDLQERAFDFLRGRGFSQAVNFSFVSGRTWERLGALLGFDPADAVRLKNPISDDTTLMRPHLLTGLLANVADNVRRFVDDIRLYEAGKAFGASYVDGHFEESRLGVILCGKRLPGDWSGANAPADFFDLKGVVEPLLLHLSPSPVHVVPSRTRMFFEEGKSADILRDGEVVGWFGAIRRELLASFDLTGAVFYGEIRLRQATASPPPRQYRALPKFPPVFRDVACVFPIDVPVGDVLAMVRAISPEVEESSVFDVFTGEKIGDGSKSVGIRVKLQPLDRTLTEAEVHSIHSKIVKLLENRFGGKIRTS